MKDKEKQRDTDTFGAKLTQLRVDLRLTQTAIATASGLSASYYSAIESNSRLPPPSDTLNKILISLKCNTKEISELQLMAAGERSLLPIEAKLPLEVQRLLIEIRKKGHALPIHFVQALRTHIREATK